MDAQNTALKRSRVFITFADLAIFKTVLCCKDMQVISHFGMLFYAISIQDALEAETAT